MLASLDADPDHWVEAGVGSTRDKTEHEGRMSNQLEEG